MSVCVLAVDDSTSMRNMVAYALKNAGYDVLEAADGELALEIAHKSQVDLVLTDVDMPDMDGIELVRALRKLPGYRLTPIVMLMTNSEPGKRAQSEVAGASGWIAKPFAPDQLISAVAHIIGQVRANTIAPAQGHADSGPAHTNT